MRRELSAKVPSRGREPLILLFTALLTLVLALGAAFPAAAHPEVADPGLSAEDIKFREELGFSTDLDELQRLQRDRLFLARKGSWGLPLSAREAAELQVRNEVLASKDVIDAYASANASDEFGGLYMDHKAGGVLVVSFTADAARHQSNLLERFPFPDRLQVRTVRFSQADVQEAVNSISGHLRDYERDGVDVHIVAPDVVNNRVYVGVEANQVRAVALIGAGFPSGLVQVGTESRPVQSRHNNYPLRGGLRITRPIPDRPGFISVCSSAFVTYYESGFPRARTYVLLTAGHCGSNGDPYTHGGRQFGTVIRDQFPGSNPITNDADAMGITMAAGDASDDVFLTETAVVDMARAQPRSEQTVGEVTRLSGQTSGNTLGTLQATGVSVDYGNGPLLRDQSLASYPNDFGDSGGSVYNGGLAKGINSGIATRSDGSRQSIFTPIENALRAVSVTLNT